MSLSLLFLFFIAYAIAMDGDLASYLYLKLVPKPALFVSTWAFRVQQWVGLRYHTYLIKRKLVAPKYVKMAEDTINPK
jgi:hypothetical protein